jgi:hypothetical protein
MSTPPTDRRVKVLDLNIGEHDPHARALVLLEMEDTQRTEFRGKATRKKSIDRIFGKIRSSAVSQVNTTQLKGLPRRSLVSDIGLSWLRQQSESDDEDATESRDENVVPMLDLKIGEQDPATNSLVALEMQETHKTGFARKSSRKKSIGRIFGKHSKVHIVHEFDRSRLKDLPRRSLAPSCIEPAFFAGPNESDDEDILPIFKRDDTRAELLDLNIGETEPATKSLVVLEMQDTQRTGFRRTPRRKESIDRIFAKVGSFKMDCGIDQRRLSLCPRRSLGRDLELDPIHEPSESDDEGGS